MLKDLHESKKQLVQIIRSRALAVKDQKRLVAAINSVREKIPNLQKQIHREQSEIATAISRNLQLRKGKIIENLKPWLLQLPDMPGDASIKNYLAKHGYNAVGKTQEDMGLRLTQLKDYIDNWVRENLDPVQGIINVESNAIGDPLKDVESINFPSIDFSSVWGKGILLTIAGIMITSLPGVGFIIGAGSVLLDLIFGKDERHAKRVSKTVDKVDRLYSKAFADAEFQFKTIVEEQTGVLIEYVNRKLTLYFSDIESQVKTYDLSSNFDYSAFEKHSEIEIPKIQTGVDDIWSELQGHLAATKLLS